MGLPTVLKANGTCGGDGVRVVHTLEEAERAFRTLQAPPLLARAVKRALVNQDKTLLWPSLLRRRSVVNAQEFVAGREATSAVACWKGAVLASLHFEVLNKRDSAAGPSSVLRLIENPEMSAAAEKHGPPAESLGTAGVRLHARGAYGKRVSDRNQSPRHASGTLDARSRTRSSRSYYWQPYPESPFTRRRRLPRTTPSRSSRKNGCGIRKANFFAPPITTFPGKNPNCFGLASANAGSRALRTLPQRPVQTLSRSAPSTPMTTPLKGHAARAGSPSRTSEFFSEHFHSHRSPSGRHAQSGKKAASSHEIRWDLGGRRLLHGTGH